MKNEILFEQLIRKFLSEIDIVHACINIKGIISELHDCGLEIEDATLNELVYYSLEIMEEFTKRVINYYPDYNSEFYKKNNINNKELITLMFNKKAEEINETIDNNTIFSYLYKSKYEINTIEVTDILRLTDEWHKDIKGL